jgi:hypothetical protein
MLFILYRTSRTNLSNTCLNKRRNQGWRANTGTNSGEIF